MKKFMLVLAFAIPILFAACGKSDKNKGGDGSENVISLAEIVETDSIAKVEENAKADYYSLSKEEKEAEILKVLNELVYYDNHNDTTYERCCTQALRNKFAQGYGICGYSDSDPEMPAWPEPGTVKITKFNPETGEVTYTVDVRWEDHYSDTSGVRKVTESATFIVEDGEIKMDTNSGMTQYS